MSLKLVFNYYDLNREVFRITNIRNPRYRKDLENFHRFRKEDFLSKIFRSSKKIAKKKYFSSMIFKFRDAKIST